MRFINRQDREILKQRYIRGIYEGLSSGELLALVNVSLSTLTNWKNNDPVFLKGIDRAKEARSKRIITSGLDMLASGYEEITEHEEWIEETNSGEMIKRKRTTKQVAPNIQAIMKLANKYTTGDYCDASSGGDITIRITQKDRSLTIEERLRILEGDKSLESLEDVTVDSKDIRYLESLELVPPTKDQD